MVYFGCKVTKKHLIFQSFIKKNIKISVFFNLFVTNAGKNALMIDKKRGHHTICRRPHNSLLYI